ncbi:glycogen-binding domain-containing protein [bacterium]|nr:glycogen-binding domain-containing protein [bacterium]
MTKTINNIKTNNNSKKTVKPVNNKPLDTKAKTNSSGLKTSSGGNDSKMRPVSFSFFDPNAEQVLLVGDFNNWSLDTRCIKKRESGEWSVSMTLKPGTYDYRFIVDGQWREDPKCGERVPNPFGGFNDRIVVK